MSRLEWILGIILLLLVLVVGLFAYRLWAQPGETAVLPTPVPTLAVLPTVTISAAPTLPFAGETAKSAFVVAAETAQQWQLDAALVTATATWPQGSSLAALQTGSATWGFTFFAPSAGETAVITVVDNQAQLVNAAAYHQPDAPPTVSEAAWELDSQQVIGQFLEAGGTNFVNEVGVASMAMALGAQNGRLAWSLTLLAPENGRSLFMQFDANSGEKLEEVAAP